MNHTSATSNSQKETTTLGTVSPTINYLLKKENPSLVSSHHASRKFHIFTCNSSLHMLKSSIIASCSSSSFDSRTHIILDRGNCNRRKPVSTCVPKAKPNSTHKHKMKKGINVTSEYIWVISVTFSDQIHLSNQIHRRHLTVLSSSAPAPPHGSVNVHENTCVGLQNPPLSTEVFMSTMH